MLGEESEVLCAQLIPRFSTRLRGGVVDGALAHVLPFLHLAAVLVLRRRSEHAHLERQEQHARRHVLQPDLLDVGARLLGAPLRLFERRRREE